MRRRRPARDRDDRPTRPGEVAFAPPVVDDARAREVLSAVREIAGEKRPRGWASRVHTRPRRVIRDGRARGRGRRGGRAREIDGDDVDDVDADADARDDGAARVPGVRRSRMRRAIARAGDDARDVRADASRARVDGDDAIDAR